MNEEAATPFEQAEARERLDRDLAAVRASHSVRARVLPVEAWKRAAPGLPPTPAPSVAGHACSECFDTGLVIPIGSREASECPCGALLVGHVAHWGEVSGIPKRHCSDGGFERYLAKTEHHGRARDHCAEYANRFAPGSDGMILAGPVGGGKTHLACAIAWRVLSCKRPDGSGYCTVRFWNTPQLLSEIRATYRPEAEEHESDISDRAINADLLVLDDYGAEKSTDHAADRLYQIINARIESMRTTIITTNLHPNGKKALQHFGEKIFSRLGEIAKSSDNMLQLNFSDHRRGSLQ